jgi:Ner family transcriptional regulator
MSIFMNTFDTPKKPANADWSRAYITAALWERGTSFRRLSRMHNYAPTALNQALNRPWPRAEAIIAGAIGLTPQQIWPSRYHPDGRPKSGRGERGLGRYKAKDTSGTQGRNVNAREAA